MLGVDFEGWDTCGVKERGLASEADEPRGQLDTTCTNNLSWPWGSGQKAFKVYAKAVQTSPKEGPAFEVKGGSVCLLVCVSGWGGAACTFQKQPRIPIGLNSMKLFDMGVSECL